MDVLGEWGWPFRPGRVEVKMSAKFARKFVDECRAAGIGTGVFGHDFVVYLSDATRLRFSIDSKLPGEMFQLRILKR
jgi:hypothetical protein